MTPNVDVAVRDDILENPGVIVPCADQDTDIRTVLQGVTANRRVTCMIGHAVSGEQNTLPRSLKDMVARYDVIRTGVDNVNSTIKRVGVIC
jgi:hypothetical protein